MNLKNLVRRLTQGDMGSYGTRWRKSLWLVFLFTLSQLILAIWAHIYAIEWVGRSAAYKELFSVARYLLPRFMGWGMLFSLLYALPQRVLWRRLLGGGLHGPPRRSFCLRSLPNTDVPRAVQ